MDEGGGSHRGLLCQYDYPLLARDLFSVLAMPVGPSRRVATLMEQDVYAERLQSTTMEINFCVEAMRDAMEIHGQPEMSNTGQAVHFTAAPCFEQCQVGGIAVSMDGKPRFLDNICIEDSGAD